MTDPLRGKYTEPMFRDEFEKAVARLAPLGGEVFKGVRDYEAFVYEAPGVHLIFYPHKTTAGNRHIRIRKGGRCEPKALRAAIFALAENSCTFQFPSEAELHREAVASAVLREMRERTSQQ